MLSVKQPSTCHPSQQGRDYFANFISFPFLFSLFRYPSPAPFLFPIGFLPPSPPSVSDQTPFAIRLKLQGETIFKYSITEMNKQLTHPDTKLTLQSPFNKTTFAKSSIMPYFLTCQPCNSCRVVRCVMHVCVSFLF